MPDCLLLLVQVGECTIEIKRLRQPFDRLINGLVDKLELHLVTIQLLVGQLQMHLLRFDLLDLLLILNVDEIELAVLGVWFDLSVADAHVGELLGVGLVHRGIDLFENHLTPALRLVQNTDLRIDVWSHESATVAPHRRVHTLLHMMVVHATWLVVVIIRVDVTWVVPTVHLIITEVVL